MHYQKTSVALAIFSILSSAQAAETPEKLNQVVVTANNTAQSLDTVTTNTSIITAEDIQNRQYHTLSDALKIVPGISTYTSGGFGQKISIFMRGMTGKNVLLLQNGIPLNDSSTPDGAANFANISLDDVERIEIIKGPQSGVWGSSASAGVINIITKKGGNNVNVTTEFGSNNHKKISATLGASNDKVDFTLNLNDVSTDGFSTLKKFKTSGAGDEKDPFAQQDAAFSMGINLDKHQRVETFVKHSFANTNYDSSKPSDTNTSSFDSNLKQISYSTKSKHVDTKLLLQEVNIYRTVSTSTYTSNTTEYSGQLKWHYAEHQNILLSASSKTTDFAQTGWTNNKTRYTNHAVSLNNTNELYNDKLILSQVIRYDEYNQFENKTTGKLGAKYKINSHIFTSANIGTGYNAPTGYQLVNADPLAKLKPETSEGYDVTFGAYNLEVTYFNNEISNKLGFNSSYKYYNTLGTSKYKGIEALYKNSYERLNTDISVSYTTQTAKDSKGENLINVPDNLAGLTLDYYGLPKTHIGIESTYNGNFYSGKYDSNGFLTGKVKLSGYTNTNLVADYQVNRHVSVYGKVQNIFNEDYITATAYNSYESDGVTPKYVYNNGGTLLFVGVRGKL